MTLVYTVAQQKGGAGKTMVAANLATWLARTCRVALLDIDPQRSLTRWHQLRTARTPAPAALTFTNLAGWRLAGEIDRLRREHDAIVIDTPPRIDTDARIAMRAASLVIIPVQPSPPDLWAAEGTLALAASEARPCRLLLNRAPAASRLRSQMERDCAARHLTLLAATLGNRIGFAAAFAAGLGVTEHAPSSQAAAELIAVAEALQTT